MALNFGLQNVTYKAVCLVGHGLSDHQLIFCTRKFSKFKTGGIHKYINFRSLKNYRIDEIFQKFKKFRLYIDRVI